jgi:hypothetical protein
MSAAALTASETDSPDSLDGWERALLERQVEALDRLAEMGMAVAAAITRRVTEAGSGAAPGAEAGPEAPLAGAALDFARVSRAVRMTFALQSRLIAEFKGAGASGADADPEVPSGYIYRPDVVDHDEVLKRQLKGVVERLGEAEHLEGEAVKRLVREAGERLEDERFFHDITERPMGEIVALVCKDLGIAPDWELLSDIYWAQSEIKKPPPGSPYVGWTEKRAQAPPLVPSG